MPLITFKPIRIPEYRIRNNARLAKALQDEAERFAKDLKRDFESTVTHWEDKPRFTVSMQLSGNTITYRVYTSSKKYLYVSGGTKKHRESPVRTKALKLALTKNVKLTLTTWKTVKAVKIPVTTEKWIKIGVFANFVKHPGIKKRDYPAIILRRRKPEFSRRLHTAIDVELARTS